MTFPPVAIVGRSCVLPGALDPDELWLAVREGRDLLSHTPEGRWRIDPARALALTPDDAQDRTWSDRGGYVSGFEDRFDPGGFEGLAPERLLALDPLFQWVLHGVREALHDAGHDTRRPDARAGAVIGNLSFPSGELARHCESVWLAAAAPEAPAPDPTNRFMSGLPAHLAARSLGLQAGAFALDAACASSLYAIKLACDRLHDGSADLMVAGAVNRADDLFIHIGFCALQALSRTGRSRPFHRRADGLVPAEGAAFLVLKRLTDAEAAGDRIHGVIRGIGLSNDGRGSGFLAPSEEGQLRALRAAYAMSGLEPAAVSLLDFHATGTAVGDAVEVRSTGAAFAGLSEVPIGSLKSNLGHLITAAGAAAILKVLGAFSAGLRPPTLHADEPLEALSGSPFRVLSAAEPWPAERPRVAGISAFGFGGNNAHLILEQWRRGRRAPAVGVPPLRRSPIAVVGLGALVADGASSSDFAAALLSGDSRLRPGPDGTRAGAARQIALPASELRFPPRDLEQTLPQQLLLLRAAQQAVAQAPRLPRERTGVFVGMQCDTEVARYGARWRLPEWAAGRSEEWVEQARDAACRPLQPAGVVGTMPNVVANRLNSQFDVAGPSFTVSAEEASGLVALDLAARALGAGEIDAAIVGAVDVCVEPAHVAAAGVVLAENLRTPGDAAVVLVAMRLDDARRESRPVLAVVGDTDAEPADLSLGLDDGSLALTPMFGHAHAASGLVHVAAAIVACRHGLRPAGASPGRPWLPGPAGRGARVSLTPLGGGSMQVGVTSARTPAQGLARGPRVLLFAGRDREELRARLEQRTPGGEGSVRLAVVVPEPADAEDRLAAAEAVADGRRASVPGVYLGERSLGGELAFVFAGPAGAYRGMGRELLLAHPGLSDRLSARFGRLRSAAGWVYEDGAEPAPIEKLWGASFLCQIHAELTRDLLGLAPTAALGFCSGETNALFALGAWDDVDGLLDRIDAEGIYTQALGGRFDVVRRAWGLPEGAEVRWTSWRILAAEESVREALKDEPRVHLAIVNAPGDVVISGDAAGCDRVVERVGADRARPLNYDLAVHCPEMAGYRDTWRSIHDRPTRDVAGIRFYTHATGTHYRPDRAAAADALLGQALRTVDFPALVRRAWDDGVRVFLEHGPQAGCSRWIERILLGRDHAAIPLDRQGESSLTTLAHAAARLWAAGVALDAARLETALASPAVAAPRETPVLRFPVHRAFVLPADEQADQAMPAAPGLPPVLELGPATPAVPSPPEHAVSRAAAPSLPPEAALGHARPARPLDTPGPESGGPGPASPKVAAALPAAAQALVEAQRRLAEAHRSYVATQSEAHARFLAVRRRMEEQIRRAGVDPARSADSSAWSAPAAPAVPESTPPPATPAPLRPNEPVASPTPQAGRAPRGPAFSRRQLERLASDPVSEVFGPLFAAQDGYRRQVRMPEPPLLLADRVLGIDGEPGTLGTGTIWTETDVTADAWYLHEDHMPAGIVIEAGQADLLLISWLGIDSLNRGERVYRLLGCELTYHGGLPAAGDTLRYEIQVDGHARQGDVRLFFFHYDCRVAGTPRLSVRGGQAGFFSDEELAATGGVLWDPETGERTADPRLDPPAVPTIPESLSGEALRSLAAGHVGRALGAGYERGETHVAAPRIPADRLLLLHEVTRLDTGGGPWGRGYLRAVWRFSPDDWFFPGHFKGDPCMPGTLMFEGCLQAMAVYLTASGHTLARDGWRFEPVPDVPYKLRCRGQATPASGELVYELFVDEIEAGPEPTLWADLLCTVDGVKAFHCRRMGVRLVPDTPLARRPETRELAARVQGAPGQGGLFDEAAVLACAWGRPSAAFGNAYRGFDGSRRLPRLPGPPYAFLSRVRWSEGRFGEPRPGAVVEAEYDVPADAWYFAAGGGVMPFCVLLEALLQPCGWLALATGVPLASTEGLYFRNLDGEGTVHRTVGPGAGALRSSVRLTRLSGTAGMSLVGFDVQARIGEEPVMSLTTGFGFFPAGALAQQIGLPEPEPACDLDGAGPADLQTLWPAGRVGGVPADPLRLLDRITACRRRPDGTGAIRAEKDVDPEAWFFKAHFFQDPVQPGSLGLEALLQLLQVYMLDAGLDAGLRRPRFSPIAPGLPLGWKYRGQVVPEHRRIQVEIAVHEAGRDATGASARADGWLLVDGRRIYHARDLALRLDGE